MLSILSNKEFQALFAKNVLLQRAAKTERDKSHVTPRARLVHTELILDVIQRRNVLRHCVAAIAYMRGHSYEQTESGVKDRPFYSRVRLDTMLLYITQEWWIANPAEKRDPEVPFGCLRDDVARWIQNPDYKPTHLRYFPRKLWKKPRPQQAAKTLVDTGISTGQSST